MTVSQAGEALRLERVTKNFGGLQAVNNVTFKVAPGERRAIIGPNGAGKTTLFNLISGELPVTTGHIYLFNREITTMPAHRRVAAGLGRTYQITNIFPGLTVEENVYLAVQGLLPVKFHGWHRRPRSGPLMEEVERLLDAVGLTHVCHAYAGEISHGEQRQLEIALAMATRPKVLLLDEPAAGLSAKERVLIRDLIRSLPRNLTVVLIEHDMDLALGLVDRVTVLHYGQVIAEGTPDEVRRNAEVQRVYLGGH